jgi:hypothetical protein
MRDSTSPTGRYLITLSAWEARMSLWIETPLLSDQSSGEQLLGFRDSHWSLDSAEWSSDSVVELKMRKYPGNHVPAQLDLKIDCGARRR